MAGLPQGFRRWSGAVYLAIAIGMVVAGTTVLNDRLQGMQFICYWLTCAMLTCLTLMIALLDFRAVRRRSMEEKNELLREVLSVVARAKASPPDETDGRKSGDKTH